MVSYRRIVDTVICNGETLARTFLARHQAQPVHLGSVGQIPNPALNLCGKDPERKNVEDTLDVLSSASTSKDRSVIHHRVYTSHLTINGLWRALPDTDSTYIVSEGRIRYVFQPFPSGLSADEMSEWQDARECFEKAVLFPIPPKLGKMMFCLKEQVYDEGIPTYGAFSVGFVPTAEFRKLIYDLGVVGEDAVAYRVPLPNTHAEGTVCMGDEHEFDGTYTPEGFRLSDFGVSVSAAVLRVYEYWLTSRFNEDLSYETNPYLLLDENKNAVPFNENPKFKGNTIPLVERVATEIGCSFEDVKGILGLINISLYNNSCIHTADAVLAKCLEHDTSNNLI